MLEFGIVFLYVWIVIIGEIISAEECEFNHWSNYWVYFCAEPALSAAHKPRRIKAVFSIN